VSLDAAAYARAASTQRASNLRRQSRWVQSLAFAAVAGAAPTLSETSGTTTTVTNGVLVPYNDPRVRWEALGVPNTGTAGFVFSDKTAGSGSGASLLPWRVSFDYDDQVFEYKLFASGATGRYRLWVDGQPISASMTTVGAIGNRKVSVDFGSRAVRRVTLELSDGLYFGGFWRSPTGTVSAPRDGSPVKLAVLGDPLAYGTGTAIRVNGYVHSLGRLLGWQNTAPIAAGGTGVVQDSTTGSNEKNYVMRLPDAVAFNPDVLIVAGSQNDQNKTAGTVQTAMQGLIDSIRSQLPNTLLIVTGLLYPATPDSPKALVNTEMQAAAVAKGVPFIDTQTVPWFFGTGFSAGAGNGVSARTTTGNTTSGSTSVTGLASGTALQSGAIVTGAGIPAGTTMSITGTTGTLSQAATATGTDVTLTGGDYTRGDGNADYYCGQDKAHPLQAGHDQFARKLASAIANLVGLAI
jgi:lysophospholipase L1-like esterase